MTAKTRKTTRRARRVLCELTLRSQILDLLRAAPRTAMEFAIALHWSVNTIYAQLEFLRFSGQAHALMCTTPGRSGSYRRWYIGPKPQPDEEEPDEAPIAAVRSNTYPLNHRRDPLVAALFGAPPCSSIT